MVTLRPRGRWAWSMSTWRRAWPTVCRSSTTRRGPEPSAIARAAELLRAAGAPLVIAGDGVARAQALPELVALAERLGARVHGEPVYRRTSFPSDHPLWRGGLFPAPSAVRKALEDCDALLVVGANVFTWFLHAPGEPFPRGLPVVQIDDDPWEIGRSYPVTLGIVADPKGTLAALTAALAERMSAADRAAAAARGQQIGAARAEAVARMRAAAEAEADRVPISQAYLMHTLASVVPDDVVVVDESATSLPFVLRYLPAGGRGPFSARRRARSAGAWARRSASSSAPRAGRASPP